MNLAVLYLQTNTISNLQLKCMACWWSVLSSNTEENMEVQRCNLYFELAGFVFFLLSQTRFRASVVYPVPRQIWPPVGLNLPLGFYRTKRIGKQTMPVENIRAYETEERFHFVGKKPKFKLGTLCILVHFQAGFLFFFFWLFHHFYLLQLLWVRRMLLFLLVEFRRRRAARMSI